MIDKNFDKIIKRKLSGMSDKTGHSNWSEFEQMLDKEQMLDHELDQKVSAEMRNMRSTYQPDHWNLLHTSLELIRERNYSIIAYKMVEYALVFVLLWSGYNYRQSTSSTFEVNIPQHYATNEKVQDGTIQSMEVAIPVTINRIEEMERNTSSTDVVKEEAIASSYIASVYTDAILTTSDELYNELSSGQAINGENTTDIHHSNWEHIESTTHSAVHANGDVTIAQIMTLEASGVHTYAFHNIEMPWLDMPLPPQPAQTMSSVSAYVGLDNNLVYSPFDQVYNKKGYETYGIGYTIGGEYSRRIGPFDMALGAEYSRRSYDPRYIAETYGSTATNFYETGLSRIAFDIVSIPVSLRKDILSTSQWDIDLGIGMSANFIVSSDYDIENILLDPYGRTGSAVLMDRRPLLIDDKPLYAGLIQGGSLADNLYTTVDISLGVGYRISPAIALELRPHYSIHALSSGVGPNSDHIHNLSLNIGLKHDL